MLENLSKPVILTGSQLPIGTLRTDGKENLITAIEIAAAKMCIRDSNELWFQAGGGIVARSQDEYELQEVNNKLGALKKAVSYTHLDVYKRQAQICLSR